MYALERMTRCIANFGKVEYYGPEDEDWEDEDNNTCGCFDD